EKIPSMASKRELGEERIRPDMDDAGGLGRTVLERIPGRVRVQHEDQVGLSQTVSWLVPQMAAVVGRKADVVILRSQHSEPVPLGHLGKKHGRFWIGSSAVSDDERPFGGAEPV